MNRQFNGDGRDALAFWTSANSTSPELVDDGNEYGGVGNAFPVPLEEGVAQTLDLVATADNVTLRGTAIVVTMGAENATTRSVSWTGTVTGAQTGDYLIMSGTLGNQLMGIRGSIARTDPPLLSGGLHGLTVAANAFWKAQVFDNPLGTGGTIRALSLPLMERPFAQLAVKSNFSINDIKFLHCNAFVKAKYVDLCVAEKRHYNQMELDGGQDAVTFNNKPLIVDPQCRRNVLYYINPKAIDILTSSGGVQWADFLDSGQFKLKAGSSGYSDAYQAFLVFYGDMATKVRNGNCVITDIDESIS
jgi:hypothetical protein